MPSFRERRSAALMQTLEQVSGRISPPPKTGLWVEMEERNSVILLLRAFITILL